MGRQLTTSLVCYTSGSAALASFQLKIFFLVDSHSSFLLKLSPPEVPHWQDAHSGGVCCCKSAIKHFARHKAITGRVPNGLIAVTGAYPGATGQISLPCGDLQQPKIPNRLDWTVSVVDRMQSILFPQLGVFFHTHCRACSLHVLHTHHCVSQHTCLYCTCQQATVFISRVASFMFKPQLSLVIYLMF